MAVILKVVDGLITVYVGVVSWMVLFGGFTLTLGPIEIRAHGYTNPVLALTGLIVLRLWLRGSLTRLAAEIHAPTDVVTQLRERVSLAMRRIRAQAQLILILASIVVGVVAATPYLLHGLTRSYYDNSGWSGPPATTARDGTLRLEGADFPWYGSWYSVEWTGLIYIPAGGVYRFALTSDDASRLWIDEVGVVDNVGTHPARTVDGRANLASGFRRIRIRYRQQQGGATFSASWRREPSGEHREAEAPLATAMLFQRQPGPGVFAIYRVGRSLVAASGTVLLVALVCIGGIWVLARRRSGHRWPAAGGRRPISSSVGGPGASGCRVLGDRPRRGRGRATHPSIATTAARRPMVRAGTGLHIPSLPGRLIG